MGVVEMIRTLVGRKQRSRESVAEDLEIEAEYRASMRRLREATADIRRSSGTVVERLAESEALVRDAVKR